MDVKEYEIEYGASRPLKFRTYVIDSEDKEWFLDVIYEFVIANVNIDTAEKMDHAHYYRLVEKMAILLCKAESPTKNYGITKPEIRWAITYWIKSISEATYRGEGNHHNEN
ncbi:MULTISPECIES: hypothetical protein [unclassified Paenibacillus]|uniref:hypothetical protein n=1 Tax=unclassified Paenibacillus TaxID=185978 RepID=UPI00362D77D6